MQRLAGALRRFVAGIAPLHTAAREAAAARGRPDRGTAGINLLMQGEVLAECSRQLSALVGWLGPVSGCNRDDAGEGGAAGSRAAPDEEQSGWAALLVKDGAPAALRRLGDELTPQSYSATMKGLTQEAAIALCQLPNGGEAADAARTELRRLSDELCALMGAAAGGKGGLVKEARAAGVRQQGVEPSAWPALHHPVPTAPPSSRPSCTAIPALRHPPLPCPPRPPHIAPTQSAASSSTRSCSSRPCCSASTRGSPSRGAPRGTNAPRGRRPCSCHQRCAPGAPLRPVVPVTAGGTAGLQGCHLPAHAPPR